MVVPGLFQSQFSARGYLFLTRSLANEPNDANKPRKLLVTGGMREYSHTNGHASFSLVETTRRVNKDEEYRIKKISIKKKDVTWRSHLKVDQRTFYGNRINQRVSEGPLPLISFRLDWKKMSNNLQLRRRYEKMALSFKYVSKDQT